jgi:GDP-mannose 6-dehydrogenase
MRVSVFGLGYVGAVTAGCLADLGHEVIGADVQQTKVDAFNAGLSPIVEPELSRLLQSAHRHGRLRATVAPTDAVDGSDVSIVCVGTPSLESGRLNLGFVRHVSQQLRDALCASGRRHAIIVRSTMLPGSTRLLVDEFFRDMCAAGQLRVYYCPEFLREGSAVSDFGRPSLAVVGTHDGGDPHGDEPVRLLGGTPTVLTWEGAELIKYSCNYFHAVKVGFANEIGRLCKFLGEDGRRVMDILCADTKLNISPSYLQPGSPFGGSCLPKDVSALRSFARQEGISLPILESTLDTNQAHLDELIRLIASKGKRRIGLLGLAFKADTDDLRGSPMVAVAETLLGRGYELHVYDPNLELGRLVGANANEIQRRMPHLAAMLRTSAGEVISRCDVAVTSQKWSQTEEFTSAVRAEQCVIDLSGWTELRALPWRYEGICW